MLTLKVNRTTVHIAGIELRSNDEFTMNACGALTRGRFSTKPGEHATATEALDAARADRRKLCKNCEKAAEAQAEKEAAEAQAEKEAAEAQAEKEAVVHVDHVQAKLALVSFSDRDGGTLIREGRRWLVEDTYGSGRILGRTGSLSDGAEMLAQHLGVRSGLKVLIDKEF